ncbi:MAG: sugar transferase [Chlamydiia bacterium]|nr:sugar transferase [Chlamydiia bacterium]
MKKQTAILHSNHWIIQHIILKRLFDIIFSFFSILFLSPLFLIIMIGIKLSSKGPVIFRQVRLGRGGKTFECLKFRTMVQNADQLLDGLLAQHPFLKAEWTHHQKLKSDPRIFWFGSFLRKTSLDELPQFWNVLKGDLSVVGPRPYMESQKKDLEIYAYKILSVRPGITGLWQTSGRSSLSFKKRLELDAKYVDRRSFWYDLTLILKTIPSILSSKHAC